MQQTETSKLNLIERDDTFSPDPLNFNAEKLSDILAVTDFGARAARDAQRKLEQRVTALEVHKIVVGIYEGGHGVQNIDVGFTPIAVIIGRREYTASACAVVVTGSLAGTEAYPIVTLTETGFRVGVHGSTPINDGAGKYNYIVFG